MWRDQFRYSILLLVLLILLLSCQETVNEEQCRTIHEEQCSTVYEEVCSTSYQQQCSTQYEQQCATVTERQCSIQYKQQPAAADKQLYSSQPPGTLVQPHTETISINDLMDETGAGIKHGAGVAAESSLHGGLSPAMLVEAEERQSQESAQLDKEQSLLANIGNLLEEMDSLSTVENLGDKISFGEAASLPIGQLPTLADTVRCAKFHIKKQGLGRKMLTPNIGNINCHF